MKRIALLLIFCSYNGFAQPANPNSTELSGRAEISVITIGPWQGEVYSAFGHSAFRVYDPELNMDDFYNYGVFTFNQPNFYLNFTRGHLNYSLGVDPYPLYRDHFISYNRFIHEQVLNLDQEQKQKVFDYLYWNALPENQFYLYDYFYNNCATKLRDVLKASLGDDVRFDSTYITTDYTIRQLTDFYLQQQPWGDLGIDICLGRPMDKKASPFEYMFLPDYIESSFDHATIRSDSSTLPLVKVKIPVYESVAAKTPRSNFHPWVVFGVLLMFISLVTYFDWRRNKLSKWLDVVLFGTVGAIGLLLLVLWFFTDHRAAARNYNILWAVPLHLVILPFYIKESRWAAAYFYRIAILNIFLLATWFWLPQQFNVFLIPLVFALTIRAVWINYYLRRRLNMTKGAGAGWL